MSSKTNVATLSEQVELFATSPAVSQTIPALSSSPPMNAVSSSQALSSAAPPKQQPARSADVDELKELAVRHLDRPALWLCINLPWLALQSNFSQQTVTGAVAVYQRHGNRDEIIQANRLARRQGIHAGTALSQAYALSPQLQAMPQDHQAEQERLQAAAAIAYQFSAQVGLLDEQSVLLELGRSLRWYGLNRLLRDLRRRLDKAGLIARIGVAPSVEAARLLSTTQQQALTNHDAFAQLRTRSINHLPFDPKHHRAMTACGIKQLGDLLRLSSAAIHRRFGPGVADYLASLSQPALPKFENWRPPLRFSQRVELAAPINDCAVIEQAADQLMRVLHQFLLQHDRAVSSCRLVLVLDNDQGDIELLLGLRQVTSELAHLRLVLTEKLAALVLPDAVVSLQLYAPELLDVPAEQTQLVASIGSADNAAAQWLDQLSARLGDDHLHLAHGVADHRAEYSWRFVPPGQSIDNDIDPRRRPLWLMQQPQPLVSVQKIEFLSGPERIESGWWDGRDCRREYFVGRDQLGRRLWLFRDFKLPEGGWFLHGLFG